MPTKSESGCRPWVTVYAQSQDSVKTTQEILLVAKTPAQSGFMMQAQGSGCSVVIFHLYLYFNK